MEDELWMRKIKERLEDYSEPLPVSGWERLEKDMPASKPKRRIIPFRRWAVAAAAVLLAAVSSVSIWLLQSPVGEEMRNTATPTLAVVPDELPGRQSPQMRTEVAEPDYRAQGQTAVPGTIAYLINQITGSFESIAFIEFNKSLSFPKKNIRVTYNLPVQL